MLKNRYGHMVHEYYVGRVRAIMEERAARLAQVQTKEDAERYVLDVRAKAKRCFPALPDRTELNAQITGRLDFDNFQVEKIVYESRPGFMVSANLYLPRRIDREVPCVLGLCGHSEDGKVYAPYQFFAQGLARKGFAVLIVDPVSQGERRQFYEEDGVSTSWPPPRSVLAHNMIGNRMLLTGDYLGSWLAWDAIRGLDYLLERPETDNRRVGVTGCSGGGTQTTFVTALDPRITMAAPDCFITSWLFNLENELPADAEQCPPNSLALGLDEADLLLAYAPRPTLILAEENCFFDLRGAKQAFAELKRIHTLLGSPDSAEISIGHLDHGFHKHAREAMYRFFIKHAGLESNGQAVEWQEPDLEEIPAADLYAADGEIVKFGSKKIFAFTQARARNMREQRPKLHRTELEQSVKQFLKLNLPEDPPHYRYLRASGGRKPELLKGYQFAVETEPGIQVLLTMYGDLENACRLPSGNVSLYIGHLASETDIENLFWLQNRIHDGERILAVDVRGIGQSLPLTCGSRDLLEPYGADYMYASYASQMGESYLGQRVFDLLRTIDLLTDADVQLSLIGRGVGSIPAVLATLLHKSQPACEIVNYLPSYQMLIDRPMHNWPLSCFLPNCLEAFDLPDIYAALGEQLQMSEPWDANCA
ncbi:acetylxylan esterase [Chloroflexi bacterium TSY]|nr:acetylxylan esterase [Chloroflexi bacterium TSY]